MLSVVFALHHALNLPHSYSLKSAYCREENAEAKEKGVSSSSTCPVSDAGHLALSSVLPYLLLKTAYQLMHPFWG